MAEDSLAREYLTQRSDAQLEDALRRSEGRVGGAQEAPGAPKASGEPNPAPQGEPRGRQPALGGIPTQVLGGARDAVVEAGQTLNDLSAWLREHGLFPQAQGPKLTVKLPEVRAAKGTTQEVTRSASQFLTGFIPFMKATKGLGLARGAAAGAATDFAVFDPHDARVSNLVNELAPALKNPVTEYLAADPADSAAEGRFKNTVEGLGLGTLADGLIRTVKALRAGKKLTAEEVGQLGREALGSEAGLVKGAPAPAAAGDVPPIKPAKPVEILKATPEEMTAFLKANPDALNLGDRVLKIGWEQLGDQKGLEEVINRTTHVFRDRVEVARRGKIGDVELRRLAAGLDMTVEDFVSRSAGTAFNAEKSLALVNLLGASATRLRGLAGQVAAGNLDARQMMLDQLSIHGAIQEQAFGVRAEAGRALRVWGMQADGTVAHASKLAQQIDRIKTGQAAAGGGLDAERLAQMLLEVDSPEKLARLAREATKPGATDMLMEFWINGLLSNPTTHVVNALSNTLTTLWAIPERQLASLLSAGGEGGAGVMKGEAAAMTYGLITGFGDALRLAGRALRTEAPTRATTKIETFSRKAISGANLGASGDIGRAVDLVGQAVRLPGRFLMASDEFFKSVNFRMELHAQAYRTAVGEGLEGRPLAPVGPRSRPAGRPARSTPCGS